MSKKSGKAKNLAITRNGNTFKATWAIPENYNDGEEIEWLWQYSGAWEKDKNKKDKWHKDHRGKKEKKITSKTFTNDLAKHNVTALQVRVRGNRDKKKNDVYTVSDWVYATYKLSAPAVSFTKSWDASAPYAVTFEGIANNNDANANKTITNPCRKTLISYRVLDVSTGKYVRNWTGGGADTNLSKKITPHLTTEWLNTGHSFRIYAHFDAYGPGGSTRKDLDYTIAKPDIPTVSGKVLSTDNNRITVQANWNAKYTTGRPVTSVDLKFCMSEPNPDNYDLPYSDSWSDAVSGIVYYPSTRVFDITGSLPKDCNLYLKLVSHYNDQTTESLPVRIMTGQLSTPTINEVTPDESTYRVEIQATNNSSVPDSHIAVYYRPQSTNTRQLVGTIESGNRTVVQCPDWSKEESYSIDIRAYLGSPNSPEMASDYDEYGGAVPRCPGNVKARNLGDGKAEVTWDWTWDKATHAIISWADSIDAWESTNQPQTYELTALKPNRWYIDGLTMGITWYIRVRFMYSEGDTTIYGEWSEINEANDIGVVHMESAPTTPTLMLSNNGVVTENGTITATWSYTSTDGTNQSHAGICIVTYPTEGGDPEYGPEIFVTDGETQNIDISGSDLLRNGWSIGETKKVAISVISGSGLKNQGYCTPVSLTLVSNNPNISLTTSDLTDGILADLPLNFNVSSDITPKSLVATIVRTSDFVFERPDGSDFYGYEGEIACRKEIQLGENTIDMEDLSNTLDYNGTYKLVVTFIDQYDQSSENDIPFTVQWSRSSLLPQVEVTAIPEYAAVKLELNVPEGYVEGDTYDVYRLSADKPQLILSDAVPGSVYYDPYPTLGDTGGHRIVYKTGVGNMIYFEPESGDHYSSAIDLDYEDGDAINLHAVVIDFASEQAILPFDLDISSSWSKAFTETRYLGGSIVGDWNPGVSRSVDINTSVIIQDDTNNVTQMRRLANYEGVCHVRTPDGSSFSADVQVQEKREKTKISKLASFSLKITAVDAISTDALTESEWVKYIESR